MQLAHVSAHRGQVVYCHLREHHVDIGLFGLQHGWGSAHRDLLGDLSQDEVSVYVYLRINPEHDVLLNKPFEARRLNTNSVSAWLEIRDEI